MMANQQFDRITIRATLLLLMELAASQARADPILPVTYSVTNVTSVNPTGFDQAGNPFNEYQNPPNPVANPVSLPGYAVTTVVAGNAAGQEIGFSLNGLTSTGWSQETGWIYSGGQFTILPYTQSAPTAINASGEVAGLYIDGGGTQPHAILYSNGHITELGSLGGATSGAESLNNQGQVVGWATLAGAPGSPTYTQPQAAFLYENGQMYNLNSLLSPGVPPLDLGVATGINNLGQILAVGQDSQVYLLTPTTTQGLTAPPPIPEVSAFAFAALAIAALGARRISRWRRGPNREMKPRAIMGPA
jgi:probable HAF family extracellular repeat protein